MKINLREMKKLQTLKGWGTSACWWSQYCADEKAAEEIAELLYGDTGLKLNIYRYNIGGGTDMDNYRVSSNIEFINNMRKELLSFSKGV